MDWNKVSLYPGQRARLGPQAEAPPDAVEASAANFRVSVANVVALCELEGGAADLTATAPGTADITAMRDYVVNRRTDPGDPLSPIEPCRGRVIERTRVLVLDPNEPAREELRS